jgi:hypothetical protein
MVLFPGSQAVFLHSFKWKKKIIRCEQLLNNSADN